MFEIIWMKLSEAFTIGKSNCNSVVHKFERCNMFEYCMSKLYNWNDNRNNNNNNNNKNKNNTSVNYNWIDWYYQPFLDLVFIDVVQGRKIELLRYLVARWNCSINLTKWNFETHAEAMCDFIKLYGGCGGVSRDHDQDESKNINDDELESVDNNEIKYFNIGNDGGSGGESGDAAAHRNKTTLAALWYDELKRCYTFDEGPQDKEKKKQLTKFKQRQSEIFDFIVHFCKDKNLSLQTELETTILAVDVTWKEKNKGKSMTKKRHNYSGNTRESIVCLPHFIARIGVEELFLKLIEVGQINPYFCHPRSGEIKHYFILLLFVVTQTH